MTPFTHSLLRAALAGCAVVSGALAAPTTASADWSVVPVEIDGPFDRIDTDAQGNAVIIGRGRPQRLVFEGERAFTNPLSRWTPAPPLPRGALPDGEAALTRKTDPADDEIAAAWYAEPTTRYDHGILGDAIEAGALVAQDGAGRLHRLRLPEPQVFEDRFPRLADIDGDGRDEIVAIRSAPPIGAELTVYRLGRDGLEHLASIPPIGLANRWLNVAGIADLTGDGKPDVALVKTPHIGGTLEIWTLDGSGMVPVASAKGFSNHAIGTREQRLSVTADIDGDGIADLAVPSDDRATLRLMSAAGGKLREIGAVRLPAAVASDIGTFPMGDDRPGFLYAGIDGKVRAVLPSQRR